MSNNYELVNLKLKKGNRLMIKGFYDYKTYGLRWNHLLKLTYKVIESEGEVSLDDFMSDYLERVLFNGILKIQIKDLYWRRVVLKTPKGEFNYNLTYEFHGELERPIEDLLDSYKFELKRRFGRNVFITILGVSPEARYDALGACESALLEPLVLKSTGCVLKLTGVKKPTDKELLSNTDNDSTPLIKPEIWRSLNDDSLYTGIQNKNSLLRGGKRYSSLKFLRNIYKLFKNK